MPEEGRDPDREQMTDVARARGLAMSLPTSVPTVQKLQKSLHGKAKTEPSYRFYSLWDKIYREGMLREFAGSSNLLTDKIRLHADHCQCSKSSGVADGGGEVSPRNTAQCALDDWMSDPQHLCKTGG